MDLTAFFTLHKDLPREGPGLPEDVRWAVELAGTHGEARICDAGCGPGADTETLAELLPDAWIDALDLHAPFAEATAARCARFGPRVKAWSGSMADLAGPYDLIWCAGAMYFLGVTEALSAWRGALTRAGKVAFSEPVLLGGSEPQAVRDFWAEYPAITGEAGIVERVERAGYRMLDRRLIIGAPWEAYYAPMEARIAELRAGPVSEALEAVLAEGAAEIAQWRAAPDRIAYLLCVVDPA
ncbi:class I SAM-dependent methyltransferase [Aliiruegeria sabulilitoris]|uniref:class I SAM-dependent methyltransferase n=1 Tax=Aliiruegeria sabulilitoris TaxID=1510458 RepID=UPI00082BE910|nr:class I SAM-dependent methyltransferase [Aliiruegeria sabulilitoris]NDR55003.1 class I SAM-dependent methyltransferase [Pseudoruegeria sp. M32A2M]